MIRFKVDGQPHVHIEDYRIVSACNKINIWQDEEEQTKAKVTCTDCVLSLFMKGWGVSEIATAAGWTQQEVEQLIRNRALPLAVS